MTNKELSDWPGTRTIPVTQLKRRRWNWLGHTLRRSDDDIAKQTLYVDTAGPQKHIGDQRIPGKRYRERNGYSWFQVQLEEYGGGGSTRQR